MAPEDDRHVVAQILADALDAQGRGARTRLAERLEVAPATITKWSQGAVLPDRSRWADVEDALGLARGTIAAIVDGPEDEERGALDRNAEVEALRREVAELREIVERTVTRPAPPAEGEAP